MINFPRLMATALLLITTGANALANTVSEAGARFPTQLDNEAGELRLAGTGVTKYRVIFTVCAVGFYVPDGTTRSQILAADTPRHLEIEYFHEIPPEDIVRASMNVLKDQLTDTEMADVRDKLDRWHESYRGVKDGDRYSMTYIPDEGTTLRLNDEALITVPGAEFAETYFGIWLKEKAPLSDRLRGNLLAKLR